MWSYMMISGSMARSGSCRSELTSSVQGEGFLENLAQSPRGLAEPARRDADGAVEGADEVGEIAKPDIVGNIGDGAVLVSQQLRRAAQPRTHQVLMRGDAEHA